MLSAMSIRCGVAEHSQRDGPSATRLPQAPALELRLIRLYVRQTGHFGKLSHPLMALDWNGGYTSGI